MEAKNALSTNVEVKPIDLEDKFALGTLRRYSLAFQRSIPTCPLGKPQGLVNPMAIHATEYKDELEEMLDTPPENYCLPIDYTEEMPTIYGVPIWEKIDNEPDEYFKLFEQYRDMAETSGGRNLLQLYQKTGVSSANLDSLRVIYNWRIRCQSYDTYMMQKKTIEKSRLVEQIENRHRNTSQQLYDMAAEYLMNNVEQMTPKMAIKMLEIAFKHERLSVGLFDSTSRQTGNQPVVNVQTTIEQSGSGGQMNVAQIAQQKESTEDSKQKLTQLLNVMNSVGLLQEDVIEATGEVVEDA